MGLTFLNRNNVPAHTTSSSSAAEGLTSENIRFLEEVGFTVIRHGHSGCKTWAGVRREVMGKGIPHTPSLRFIEIAKQ